MYYKKQKQKAKRKIRVYIINTVNYTNTNSFFSEEFKRKNKQRILFVNILSCFFFLIELYILLYSYKDTLSNCVENVTTSCYYILYLPFYIHIAKLYTYYNCD